MTEPFAGAEPWSHQGSGPDADIGIVVAHGFSGNPVSTRPLGEALAAAGYTVEVPRLPGHGTTWQDLKNTRYPHWRASVDRAFEDVTRRCRAGVLVGLSMGGSIVLDLAAMRCANSRATRLAGVVAINGLVVPPTGVLARFAPIVQYLVPTLPPAMVGIAENDIKRGGDERAYDRVPLRALQSFVRELPRIQRHLSDVTVPVLVAQSREDHTVPSANGPAIAEGVGTDDVRIVHLEESYHVATMDHDADRLAGEIIAFVQRVTADV